MIFDVGINDSHDPVTIKRSVVTEYRIWYAMLARCYSSIVKEKHPSYKECHVSETFKSYENFKNWCRSQVGFGKDGFELDKDILGDGFLYSEDNCAFVPYEINLLFVLRGSSRGLLPLGVCKHTQCDKYIARLNCGKVRTYLGLYDTAEEAHYAYKEAKLSRIKELAMKYKDDIDHRVFEKLINMKEMT